MDIDDMFNKHNTKRQEEKDLVKAEREKQEAFRNAGYQILQQEVKPVLDEAHKKIESNDGKSKVDFVECMLHPRIVLEFAIEKGHINSSSITFRHDKENKFVVDVKVVSDRHRKSEESTTNLSHEYLTKDKAESLTQEFISKVFEAA